MGNIIFSTIAASGLLLNISAPFTQTTSPKWEALRSNQTISQDNTVPYMHSATSNDELFAIAKQINPKTFYASWMPKVYTEKEANALPITGTVDQRLHEIAVKTHGSATVVVQKATEAEIAAAQATPIPTLKPVSSPTSALMAQADSIPTLDSVGGSKYDSLYKMAGAKFGVPWQILYGLHITETGGRDGLIPNKSGSGATGPMQFMPGTWRAYGVDCTGDGVADISNVTDAVCGAANYISRQQNLDHGLRRYGGAYGRTVALARERGFTGPLK